MRGVRDIPVLEDIPVLVRAALNVPLEGGRVMNAYRLRQAVATIDYLRKRRAKVVLISHLGEGGTETLAPVARALGTLVPGGVSFFGESIGQGARDAVRKLSPGGVIVLENLRRHRGERENDPVFSRELSLLADIFVQDSFDTCHRQHASIVGVPKLLPSYAGLELETEVRELSQALHPARPALAVIGGAKFATKEAVLTSLLRTYDHVFVGGALANDFLKAAGHAVGASRTGEDSRGIARLLSNQKLVLPVDSIVAPASDAAKGNARSLARVAKLDEVRPTEAVLDHGPATVALLADLAKKASSVLWNGPLGNYENGFTDATEAFAHALSSSRAHSVVGGGDTIAAIERLNLLSRFSFVSIGGGAMLEFLARGTLPGIEALS